MQPKDRILLAARVAHEVNRAFCQTIGDYSQPKWDEAPDWQKESTINGVRGTADGTITSPEQSHESWLAEKERTGWKYGPVKNPETREHPCMVPYSQLPPEQRTKDDLFQAVVSAVLSD